MAIARHFLGCSLALLPHAKPANAPSAQLMRIAQSISTALGRSHSAAPAGAWNAPAAGRARWACTKQTARARLAAARNALWIQTARRSCCLLEASARQILLFLHLASVWNAGKMSTASFC